MYKISDPKDKVFYIEDRSFTADGVIDPHLCFSDEDEAVEYAIKTLKLSVLEFNIMEWTVD